MTNIIDEAVTGHGGFVADEGVPAWVRYQGELDDRRIGDGDLILDLSGGSRLEDLIATRILDRWADALDFSLGGIDGRDAFQALVAWTLMREFVAVPPSFDAFGRRAAIENSRIRVHRDAVMQALVESFDGPFDDNRSEFWDAALTVAPSRSSPAVASGCAISLHVAVGVVVGN
ncbi:hypothetical protein ACTJKH_13185 [Microbacterium sp. 22215]|uniref:hypothetical protein n=1 Tax=Microbacterium sp. 22215 TaxID=3453893 RepID=UPI003F84C9EA